MSFVNAGSNYLLNVLDSLLTEPYEGVKPFASIYGQVSKYRGHGDLEIKGFEFIGEIGQRIKLTDGFIKVGLFAESGIRTYSTHNSYCSKSIKGKGLTNYEG